MNYYSRTKNDLESFLINKLKKEGWSQELKIEAQVTSNFLYESYVSYGLYPYSTEAYNICLSKHYIVHNKNNVKRKILFRKKLIINANEYEKEDQYKDDKIVYGNTV
jgi:hypothetical protein